MSLAEIETGLKELERWQELTMTYLGTDYPVASGTLRRGDEVEFNGRSVSVDRTIYLRVELFSGLGIATLAGKVVAVNGANFRVVNVGMDPNGSFVALDLADITSGR